MIHIDSLAKPHEPDSHLASRDYKHHIFEKKKVKSPEISNNEVDRDVYQISVFDLCDGVRCPLIAHQGLRGMKRLQVHEVQF